MPALLKTPPYPPGLVEIQNRPMRKRVEVLLAISPKSGMSTPAKHHVDVTLMAITQRTDHNTHSLRQTERAKAALASQATFDGRSLQARNGRSMMAAAGDGGR